MFFNEKPFDATIHRNSRCNFRKPSVTKDVSKKKATKADAMENKAMAKIIEFAQELKTGLNLSEVMAYRLTEECLPIFNINGTIRKGQKSKLTDRFNFVELQHPVNSYIAIVDMGFIWRLCTPSAEDRENMMKVHTRGVTMPPKCSIVLWSDIPRHPRSYW